LEYSSKRIPELDGLRGIAISLVLFGHYFVNPWRTIPGSYGAYLQSASRLTGTGVDLFFILSGFLIGGILLDRRSSGNYFQAFYARRFFRIFPLYYSVLCAFVFIAIYSPHLSDWLLKDPLPSWSYFAYVQNYLMGSRGRFGPNFLGITWSLAIEEQFYLTLPLLVWLLKPRYLRWLLIAYVIAAPAIRYTEFLYSGAFGAYVYTLGRADALLFGVLIAMAYRTPGPWKWVQTRSLWLWIAFFFLLLGMIPIALKPRSLLVDAIIRPSWVTLLFGCLLVLSLSPTKGIVNRTLCNRYLRQLGVYAYCLYLIHQAVIGLCYAAFRNSEPKILTIWSCWIPLLALFVCYWVAVVSWRYFESPLLDVGHRVGYTESLKSLRHLDRGSEQLD
jgi:peptidoglycan/LPS O-acetylase OafA/YrhL